ncbi:hypothetical protein P43SY_002654 [Pythium insidiosum]|uniref:VHS domain-containing protein n=1 Tax=Pythium insidiosum TaxID=114742 RepID=A0AAD5QB19_PYTIN|nr:hypothetical protein P43SY_002654 [Pythium insidiosum]
MSAYAQGLAEVEELIEKATADHLSGPEWHLNLMICDAVNANNAISDDVVHILQRKLQSGSPRVALLALVVVETLVKNGSAAFHTQVASRTFLQEIAAMTDGSLGFDVQNKALELIKQWADAFAGSSLTAFQDTYRMLKIQGVAFPEIEHDAPVFTPPTSVPRQSGSSRSITSASGAPRNRPSTREQQIAKLHSDLKVVLEKIQLFRDLRRAGQQDSEPMEDVLDFLRQCQPRMNTLIEGGVMGKLDERTFEECLNVNDHLVKALDELRTPGVGAEAQAAVQEDLISFDSPKRKPLLWVLSV